MSFTFNNDYIFLLSILHHKMLEFNCKLFYTFHTIFIHPFTSCPTPPHNASNSSSAAIGATFSLNHFVTFRSLLANHWILFSMRCNASLRAVAPAPASGYLAKNTFTSFNLVVVVNPPVIAGIRRPK